MGIKPSLCATISSTTIDVLSSKKTFSIAIVGTSESMIRRNALAREASIPMMSKIISSPAIDFTCKGEDEEEDTVDRSRSIRQIDLKRDKSLHNLSFSLSLSLLRLLLILLLLLCQKSLWYDV